MSEQVFDLRPIGLIWQSEDCHIIQEGRRIQLAKATALLRLFQCPAPIPFSSTWANARGAGKAGG